MAHTLFDVFQGGVPILDNQTALAVQSLLDSQVAISTESTANNVLDAIVNVNLDDDDSDVFQCGKCKKQFTTLEVFIRHKRETCTALSSLATTNITTPTSLQTSTLTTHSSSSFNSVSSSSLPQVVLNEADLLSLAGIDTQALTIPLQTTASVTPYLTRVPTGISTSQSAPNEVGSQLTSLSSSQQVMLPLESGLFRQSNGSGSPILTMAAFKNVQLLTKTLVTNNSECDDDVQLKTPLIDTLDNSSNNMVSQSKNDDAGILCTTSKDGTLLTYSIVTKLPVIQGDMDSSTATVATDGLKDGNENDKEIVEHVMTELSKDDASKCKKQRLKAKGILKVEPTKKKTNKLHCTFCQKGFAKNFDLQQHIRSHTGEKPFQCIVCGRAFAQKSNVKKHMQTHKVWPDGLSNTLPKQPLMVQKEQNNKNNILEHNGANLQTKVTEKQSETCGSSTNERKESASKDDAEIHTNFLIDNSYVCQYCNQAFKTYCQLKTHLKIHKNEQVYKCIVKKCGQTFQELDAFLDHMRSHEDEMKYRCHVCTKQFHSLYELGDHQYSHSLNLNQPMKAESRHYRCTKCMNKYSTPEALDHHMSTSTHSYPCVHCKKVFPCERYLRRHLPTHGSTAKHTCTVCNGSFKTEHYLRMHMLIHSGDKPFQCWQCSASFNRKDKLKRHLLIHEPVKRFKCPFCAHNGCNKAFHRPDKLKAHILTHSGFRPYQCYQCSRGFSRRAHMREHMRLHEEENHKFTCKTCGKGFNEEAKLKDHTCNNNNNNNAEASNSIRKRCTSRPIKLRRTSKKSSTKISKKSLSDTLFKESTTERKKVGRPRKKPPPILEITAASAASEVAQSTEQKLLEDVGVSNKPLNSTGTNEPVLDDDDNNQLIVNCKHLTEMQTMVEDIVSSVGADGELDDNHLTSLDQGSESVLLTDDGNSLGGSNACNTSTYAGFETLPEELQLGSAPGGVDHNYSGSSTECLSSSVLPCKVTVRPSDDESQNVDKNSHQNNFCHSMYVPPPPPPHQERQTNPVVI